MIWQIQPCVDRTFYFTNRANSTNQHFPVRSNALMAMSSNISAPQIAQAFTLNKPGKINVLNCRYTFLSYYIHFNYHAYVNNLNFQHAFSNFHRNRPPPPPFQRNIRRCRCNYRGRCPNRNHNTRHSFPPV
ncbi:hypothetical protein K432DRAFT_205619 [Lepidopterella palustris CBS 459.81]|uniref:Uncharacterized protein n=1 Tax=Lepidopterella palustris CBS 459.81 TaxID=1314670 RepID=A0A8E2JHJ8_9PEZI|nr:hypothetical protein K432DRAFT_205619 [Lepidopterella palustris CBS 459.81]